MSTKDLLDRVSLVLAVVCFVTTAMVVFVLLWPFHVLEDWKLTVSQPQYFTGETVTVHSSVTKLRKSQPFAHRNVECKNASGVFVSYHLADVQGVNSNVGHLTSQIPFNIPDTIPDLPTTCRFSITATYHVFFIRTITEYSHSNDFTVSAP